MTTLVTERCEIRMTWHIMYSTFAYSDPVLGVLIETVISRAFESGKKKFYNFDYRRNLFVVLKVTRYISLSSIGCVLYNDYITIGK